MLKQKTIREKCHVRGVGLHSGRQINLEILPAPADNGITFVRTDLGVHEELRASVEHVADTTLATTLAVGVNGSRAVVGTVEHLLAAFAGLGIDNARVLLDGPEVPVMDGSAEPFVELLQSVGIEEQRRAKRYIVIRKEVSAKDGDKRAKLSPGKGFKIKATLDFDHPLISTRAFSFDAGSDCFVKELSRARTFGFLKDVEALRARGLAQGGSLDNAVVVDKLKVMNPEGLRFADEFVRHKILDAIGDMSLFGMPIVGRLELHRSGHALNTDLVRRVLQTPDAFTVVQPKDEAHAQEVVHGEPAFGLLDAMEGVA